MDASDEQLAVLARDDSRYFDALILRHNQALLNFIHYKFCGSLQQAEDVVQEAHLKAYLNLRVFDPSRKWRTWLFGIAINTAKSSIAKTYSESLESFNFISDENPEQFTELVMEKELLIVSLALLPEQYRNILNWHYIQGLDIKEIAKRIKKPAFSIKNRLRFAEKLLLQSYHCASLNCNSELPFKT